VWADDEIQQANLGARLHTTASRVHAVELSWLDRIRTTALYAYRLPGATFRVWTDEHGQWVSTEPVTPLGVESVGDLLARHVAAGIELRLVADLGPLRELVLATGLPFSMVRMGSARHTEPT